jgi:hypothetical protein
MGLKDLKIIDGIQTLPRASQKDNLANIVASTYLSRSDIWLPKKVGEGEKNEDEY